MSVGDPTGRFAVTARVLPTRMAAESVIVSLYCAGEYPAAGRVGAEQFRNRSARRPPATENFFKNAVVSDSEFAGAEIMHP